MTAHLVEIESGAHAALQPYTAVRERDLVGREGLFIAEGDVVLRVLVSRSKLAVRSLLLAKRRVEAVTDILEAVPDGVPAYVVSQSVMDEVVGFSIHRGVLALGERGPAIDPRALLAGGSVATLGDSSGSSVATLGDSSDSSVASLGDSIFVGLVGLTNHDNVGGIFRNAAAFGASGVLLDGETCDPLYRKAIRVLAGAALVVPFARCASIEEMLAVLEEAKIEPIALTPRGEEAIDALPPAPRALLLGTEGAGLPEAVLRRTRRVRIDMAPGLDSLNVSVASGIALHEVRRALRRSRREP